MRRVMWLAGLLLIAQACIADTPVLEQKEGGEPTRLANAARGTVLPDAVLRYLKQALPEYRPVTPSDYDPIWFNPRREYCAQRMSIFNWALRADFDGDGNVDYAILLRGEDDKDLKAFVIVRATESGWTHDILDAYRWPPLPDPDKPAPGDIYNLNVSQVIELISPGLHSLTLTEGLDPDAIPLDHYGEPIPTKKALFRPFIFSTFLETDSSDYLYIWEKGKWLQVFVGL